MALGEGVLALFAGKTGFVLRTGAGFWLAFRSTSTVAVVGANLVTLDRATFGKAALGRVALGKVAFAVC